MLRRIQELIKKQEGTLRSYSNILVRLALAVPLFFSYLLLALVYAASVIFSSPQKTFQQWYGSNPKKGYSASYTEHRRWHRGVQSSAVITILAAVLVNVIVGAVFSGPQAAYGVECTITASAEITQTYINDNNCSGLTIQNNGTVITWSGTTDLIGAGTVTIASGTVSFSGAMILGSSDDLVVASGANLSGPSAPDGIGLSITANDVTVTGNLVGNNGCAGGAATAEDGKGPDANGNCVVSTAGYGLGGTTTSGAGGSHGGAGGRGGNAFTGTTYGSNTAPVTYGSGGGAGNDSDGGNGGGRVRVDASGTLTVDGLIRANGSAGEATEAAYGGGGGAGGSVYITTATFAGSGSIQARGGAGGNGTTADGGGGGGGRIAVYYITDSSTFLSGMTASVFASGGAKGTGGSGSAADGAAGSLYTQQYTVPTTPSVSSPANAATDISRTPTVTGSDYASNGKTHSSTDWQISDDNTFSDSDCSDTNIVYCSMISANLASLQLNSANGTFQNGLSGKTKLAPNSTYYVRVRYTNVVGSSGWSGSIAFTTQANSVPAAPTNATPADNATDVSKNPTLSASTFSDSDGDTHASTDWFVYSSGDCSGTTVWQAVASSGLSSVVVNNTNGTFQNALSGSTSLAGHTTYSFLTRYTDSYSGTSNSSTCTDFTTANTAPVATAGDDQTVSEDEESTTLDGSGSSDGDGDSLTYTWSESVDSGDGCSLEGTASASVTVSLENRSSNYSCTFQTTVQDGRTTVQDSMIVNVVADDDPPVITSVSDKEVNEGDELSFGVGVNDIDSATVSFSIADTEDDFERIGLDLASFFIDNGDNTATFSWTPGYTESGGYTMTITANDATNATQEIVNITVQDVVSYPMLESKIPSVSFVADRATGTVLNLNDYFSDEGGFDLSFTASGHFLSDVEITDDGDVSFGAPQNVAGTDTVMFTATNPTEHSLESNSVVVRASAVGTNVNDTFSHVLGTRKGRVKIYNTDGSVRRSWLAQSKKKSVITALATAESETVVVTMRKKDGKVAKVYSMQGDLLQKKKFGQRLHWKRVAIGHLDNNEQTIEIIIARKEKSTLYFNVFGYDRVDHTIGLLMKKKKTDFTSSDYQVNLYKRTVTVTDENGDELLAWKL